MKFCTLEQPSRKLLYFIGFVFFVYTRELLEDQLDIIFIDKRAEYFEFIIFYTIGDLFCGFFVLIVSKRTQNENLEKKIKSIKKDDSGRIDLSKRNSLIYNNTQNELQRIAFKRVFYLSIYDLLAQSCIIIFSFIYTNEESKMPHHNINLSLIFDIISRFILNKIMLGMKFYPHYYLSISINILSFIILSISDLYYMITEGNISHWIYLIQTIIGLILYSFENVEGKIGLNSDFLNPYNLIFYKGIIQSVFVLIISIIFLILKKFYLFTGLFDNPKHRFNFLTIIIVFVYLILNMFSNICIWKIIDFYSIQHLTIAKGLSFFVFYIGAVVRHKLEYQFDENLYLFYFTDIFGYILLFIGTLIHNEIIILNCCNLSTYTYKELKEREIIDLKTMDDSINASFELQTKKTGETLTSNETIKTDDILNDKYSNNSNSILEESDEF